ncbi:MAG: sulfatase-like hydrolase/transferase [Verrucomicrobia bacterium]|nr:sulfatase-like hydrolase/transferase [Verrucomicrobiota bacterium]
MKTLLTLIASTLVFSSSFAAAPARPNIIVILSDDMGYADLCVYGGKDVPTPHIDSLGKDGVRFTDAYANGSVCTPTRAALLSGRYQHRYGVEDLCGKSDKGETCVLPPQANPLPLRLKRAGYTTGMMGKWHLGEGEGLTPMDRGFDECFGFLGGGHHYIIRPYDKSGYDAPITFDISATALAVGKADMTACDGVNLLPFLAAQQTGAPHAALFWRDRLRGNHFAARQGDWKLVHSAEYGEPPGPVTDRLFNLAQDLSEQHDLAAENPGKLAELKKLYETWSADVDADCRKLGLEPKFPKTAVSDPKATE